MANTAKEITIEFTVGAEKGNGPLRLCPIVAAADNESVTLTLENIKIEVVA